MEIELIKMAARIEDKVETTHLWFEATINGVRYGDQMVLFDPSSYTKSTWQGIGKHILEKWENLRRDLNDEICK